MSVSEITKGNFTFQNDVITYIFKYVSFTLKSIDHKKLIEKFINSNYLIESQFWKEKYYIAETKKKKKITQQSLHIIQKIEIYKLNIFSIIDSQQFFFQDSFWKINNWFI